MNVTIEELEAEVAVASATSDAVCSAWIGARDNEFYGRWGFYWTEKRRQKRINELSMATKVAEQAMRETSAIVDHLQGMLDIARTTGLTDRGQLEMLWKLSKP